jgi:excisionase family DNA binding protein
MLGQERTDRYRCNRAVPGVLPKMYRECKTMSIVDVLEKTQHALTVADVAKILNMSPRTIYHHVASGRIPGAVKIGSAVRFDPTELAGWLRRKASVGIRLASDARHFGRLTGT